MKLFDIEIDVDEYADKLDEIDRSARKKDLHHSEVMDLAEEKLSEKEFKVFTCALLRGCLSLNTHIDDLAQNARRVKEERQSDEE